jgi:OOP family OmpA-OmpF porin
MVQSFKVGFVAMAVSALVVPAALVGCTAHAEVKGGSAAPPPEPKESKVAIPGNVDFDTNKATIRPTSEPTLTQVKTYLDQHPEVTTMRIEGHTDTDGDPAMNVKLSGERALAVCNWLVQKGIARERLIAVGFGQTKPLAANDTEEHKKQNRRVEYHIAAVNGKNFMGKDPTAQGTVFKLAPA